MGTITTHTSRIDASVNWVEDTPLGLGGAAECRYVRREDDYFIAYVSAQTGCAKACRFCFLTQTGQTATSDLPLDHVLAQAEWVCRHYDDLCMSGGPSARMVHFNFMARGEALASRVVREQADDLMGGLAALAGARGLGAATKLSTIMPREMEDADLVAMFGRIPVDFYYSIYSTDQAFRRRWMPKALPVSESLAMLADYQRHMRKIPTLHWALIADENDRPNDTDGIVEAVRAAGLRVNINLVRYNPFSERQGRELERVAAVVAQLEAGLPEARVRVIDRIGYDVNASCGMFIRPPASG